MNVLIIQQRNWSVKFGIDLANELKKKGHNIGSITVKKSTHNFILSNGYNKNVWSHDEIIDNPKKYISTNKKNLNEISEYLNINSVWELIQSQRNLVKDYNRKYYYSFKQAVPDEYIENYIKSCFGMVEEIFVNFKPDIVISPSLNSFIHAMLNLYCERNNTPIFATTDSKVDNINIFTNSYLDNKGSFIDYLTQIREGKIEIDYNNLYEEEKFIKNKILQLKKIESIDIKLNVNLYYILNQIKLFTRSFKFKKNMLGSTQDLTDPTIFLRDLFFKHYYNYKTRSFKYDNFDVLNNFAFMPLLLQPEENIDLVSTRFNNQIETARLIAMSLPADMSLVVKDHPHMSTKRSPSYLEKIKHLPNVKLVSSSIPNWKIFEKTKIVIAISGTSVFEASILGKQTIQLGNLGTIKMLPNVHHHSDLKNIRQKINEILNQEVDKNKNHKRMLEYIHAAFKKGQKYDLWNNDLQNNINLKKELLENYCKEIGRLTKLKV